MRRHRRQSPARRWAIPSAATALVLLLVSACGSTRAESGPALPDNAPIPTQVPADTVLIVGDPETKAALELSGRIDDLPFEVEWANLSGGPKTTRAIRAGALDLGSVAPIPPLHATWTGLDIRIVAARVHQDPLRHQNMKLAIAPGAPIRTIAELRGKRIAYSPGQAQGALVLKLLHNAGLSEQDVQLVEMASTGNTFMRALTSGQVDAAPMYPVLTRRYLAQYGDRGARVLDHEVRDDAGTLYAPVSTLRDANKAAAVQVYLKFWAEAQKWIDAHPKEWIEGYYMAVEGLSSADGRRLVEQSGKTEILASWDELIQRQQHTADVLARAQGWPRLNAAHIWDRRYEPVAAGSPNGGAP